MDEIEKRARKMLADEYGCDMCEVTDSEVRAARVALRVAAYLRWLSAQHRGGRFCGSAAGKRRVLRNDEE